MICMIDNMKKTMYDINEWAFIEFFSKGKSFDLLFIHSFIHSFIHALLHSLSQPMKREMVHKICGHLNQEAKEYFLIVSQISWEAMRNVSFS